MRKFIIGISILLIIPATIYAGFSFGLIQATKKTGEKVDAKVAQKKAKLLINSQTPSSLTVVAVSSTQINISWTVYSSVGIVNYKVYRNGNAAPIATPTSTAYSDTGLTFLTVYSYQVSACNSAGNCSPLSALVSATTPDTQAPTVPTNLTVVAVSSCQINLSWSASTDEVGVTSYKLYRDGGAAPIATPTGTTYNNTGLISSTTYSYAISACDAAGNCSAQSITASTTTPDTQAPTVPTNLTAVVVSSCQINLNWTASADDVGVVSYKIYRDGGATPIATPTGTTYNNTGLISSTTYSYAISACDAAGNCSAQSITASTTTPDTQAPTVPTNLTAVVVSSCQINLNWTASADDIGVVRYKIYRDGGATPIATPTGTTYNDSGLTASTLYSYTVSACDAAGNCSGQSSAATGTTPQPPPIAGGEWVLVPGSAAIGTSDFYVMTYEAKNVGGVSISRADVAPWVNITQTNAIAACSALGGGAHLLTIPETQTINRNIEAQAANWANGTIGSLVSTGGGLKRGNAGTTDSASYTLATTGPDYVGANTGSDRTSTSKAKLVLSNGEVIWDWAGNVEEWVYGAGAGGTLGTPGGVTFDVGNPLEWNSVSPDLSQERMILGPSNGSYTSLYGAGRYVGGVTTNAMIRGGDWSIGVGSGVFYFNAGGVPSGVYGAVGFRCGR